jgi:hypothetical protein
MLLLRIAVFVELGWISVQRLHAHSAWGQLLYPLLVTVGFAVLAIVPDKLKRFPAILRMFIGVAFMAAVADRLGGFGGPGTPGVSWGDFAHFIAYTAKVNAFLPASVIPSLAVIESLIEGALGLAMLLGLSVRNANLASAGLLACFGSAMSISLGFTSQFPFAVFVLCFGALLLATLEVSARWSGDVLIARFRKTSTQRRVAAA